MAEAYWRCLLLSGPAREAERFAVDLRRPPLPSITPAAAQFIERMAALAEEVAAIEADERALNETLYDLYRLSPDERNLVENERGRRNDGGGRMNYTCDPHRVERMSRLPLFRSGAAETPNSVRPTWPTSAKVSTGYCAWPGKPK